ncbi:hypothetical protein ACWF62_14210 [Rhodococcus sp. NPDC054953]
MSTVRDPFDFSDYAGSRPDSDTSWSAGTSNTAAAFDPFSGESSTAPGDAGSAFGGFASGGTLDVFGAQAARLTASALSGEPPVKWLVAAGVAAVVGAGTGVGAVIAGGPTIVAFLGWLLAGPAAVLLLGGFTTRDTAQRALPSYTEKAAAKWCYGIVAAVALVGIVLGAWSIADWAGRL